MSQRQSLFPEHIQKQIASYTSSSYRETVDRGYTCFSVAVPRDTIIATQRTLVDNAMSMQELVSQVFRMIAEKNPVFAPVFSYAKENPINRGYDYVIINENSIYSMIEDARRHDAEQYSMMSKDEENYDRFVADTEEQPADIGAKTVRAPIMDFKTYKPDKFLQRKVTDAIVKLKQQKASSKLTDVLQQVETGKKD
jgi:hypothetical protein